MPRSGFREVCFPLSALFPHSWFPWGVVCLGRVCLNICSDLSLLFSCVLHPLVGWYDVAFCFMWMAKLNSLS